ncbi:outer membrane beta-barrel protein [Arundinibacter roseus]|uniref:Porin opacity type domain-containing protein n=1 Tax=Arundinibacter roseus TaxID=2070510 RepID=A0A4R4KA63_9BACT|nr:outer membrane beta-barrel protein [Arundinibacter roseus]TDB63426.1 hypothetical protein EZE20_16825 [Arundinibacter roseus]
MKKFLPYVWVLLGLLFSSSSTLAQLSVEANAGYGLPTETGSAGVWGGGVAVKYYLNSQMAFGVRGRLYAESIQQSGNGISGSLTAVNIPIMGMFEYHFSERDLHPYVGMEAGVIRSALTADISFNRQQFYNDTVSDLHLGVAPKAGVGYDLTQGLTAMAEVIYTVGFGKNQAGNTQFNLESASRFLTVHAGLSFTFGNRYK